MTQGRRGWLRNTAMVLLGDRLVDRIRFARLTRTLGRLDRLEGRAFAEAFAAAFAPEAVFVPRFLPPRGAVIVDIGAHYGTFSFFFARQAGPRSQIHVFEPVARTYRILARCKAHFGLDHVHLNQMALGSRPARVEMIVPEGFTGLAHVVGPSEDPSKQARESIAVDTLDHYVSTHALEAVHFVKCDVEGFEPEVLRGAEHVLRHHQPVWLMEIEARHLARYGAGVDEVWETLRGAGYRAFVLRNGTLEEATAITTAANNYFFVPEGTTV